MDACKTKPSGYLTKHILELIDIAAFVRWEKNQEEAQYLELVGGYMKKFAN
jgi:hypothetical protein